MNNPLTPAELHVLQETRRVWIAAATSNEPFYKYTTEEYSCYNNCPACKHHKATQDILTVRCHGFCLLSKVWGSTEPYACENADNSPYNTWTEASQEYYLNQYSARKTRSAAWRMAQSVSNEITRRMQNHQPKPAGGPICSQQTKMA